MLSNSSGPAYASIPLKAGKAGSPDLKQITSVNGFLAPATEGSSYIGYDADGNLTSDGRWTYTWDAENRLTSMQTTSAAISAGLPGKKLEFRYDSTGRRTSKKVSTWSGSAWTVQSEVRFVDQGWNLVAELDTSGNRVRTYAWGLDIASSLSATGGIGALVQLVDHTGTVTAYHPGYDGSGNVAAVMKDDGTIVAAYEYGPFGELLRKDGAYAAANPIRNATKYTDDESGYVYYGTRYYDPRNGRFLNRDTIEEQGGLNLYAFCGNNGINQWDYLGRDAYLVFDGCWREGEGPNGDDLAYASIVRANHQDYISQAEGAMAGALRNVDFTALRTIVTIGGKADANSSELAQLKDAVGWALTAVQQGGNIIADTVRAVNLGLNAQGVALELPKGFERLADGLPELKLAPNSSARGSLNNTGMVGPNGSGFVSTLGIPDGVDALLHGDNIYPGLPHSVEGGTLVINEITQSRIRSSGGTGAGMGFTASYYHNDGQIYNWSQTVTTDTLPHPGGNTPYPDGLRGADAGMYYPNYLLATYNPPGASIFRDRPFDTGPGSFSAIVRPVPANSPQNSTGESPFTLSWGFTVTSNAGAFTVTPAPILIYTPDHP